MWLSTCMNPPLVCSHFGGALAEPDSFPGRSLLRGRQHSIQHRPLEKASNCFSGFWLQPVFISVTNNSIVINQIISSEHCLQDLSLHNYKLTPYLGISWHWSQVIAVVYLWLAKIHILKPTPQSDGIWSWGFCGVTKPQRWSPWGQGQCS